MLTGCTAAQPPASGTAPSSPTSTSSAGSTPATTSATPTCETALLPGAYKEFASRSLRPRDLTEWGANPNRKIEAVTIGGEGITCSWTSEQGDGAAYFAQIAMTEAEWGTLMSELRSDGFVEQDKPVAGYFNGPIEDPLYNDGGFFYRDGYLYYTLVPDLTAWIPAVAK